MIYFVGAGPGAEDLITLRGDRLLRTADVIIYAGSLVNPGLLKVAKPDCAIHDSAAMTLEAVIETLVAAEKDHKLAVRLHTGDPSIYGAIREQIDALKGLDIPFEVVPGVSALNGAAASLQAEYTLPGISQTVIITRVEGRTPVPEWERIAALAAHGATMAVFLSTGLLDKLVAGLLEGGYPADCPAAIVYKATWPDEKVVRTTVAGLQGAAEAEGITKTALILVGRFLGDDYDRSLLYHPGFTHGFREASQ